MCVGHQPVFYSTARHFGKLNSAQIWAGGTDSKDVTGLRDGMLATAMHKPVKPGYFMAS